jgi:hypothetical protein
MGILKISLNFWRSLTIWRIDCDTETIRAIEEKRKEMIAIGMRKGFADDETISLSEELDKLINLHLINHKLISN